MAPHQPPTAGIQIDGPTLSNLGNAQTSKIRHLRWWLLGLLTTATALNYLDRQTLPVVVNVLNQHFVISTEQFAELNSLFLLAYGCMYLVGGKIMDVLGTRLGYAVMIVWWSAATFLQGAVNGVRALGALRFLLGMGEGGGFPGSAKAVSEWFPPRERSLAVGIFNTGSALGAIVAPPLIAFIVLSMNWRWVFFLTGAAGFVWVAFWLMFYQTPAHSTLVTQEERDFIFAAQTAVIHAPVVARRKLRWAELLEFPQIWGLIAAKVLTDSAWYFFAFWLPKYLGDARHLDIKQIGYYAWIPWIAAGLGSFCAGSFSTVLMHRGMSLDRARKWAMGVSVVLLPATLLITAAPLGAAIIFFSLAYLGHQSWSTIIQTLPADLFPSDCVGSTAGLLGAAGAFGAMLFSLAAGAIIHKFGYGPVFAVAGLLHPLAFIIVLRSVGRIERIC